MVVMVKHKMSGRITRHPMVGNVSFEDGRIVLVDDPRCGYTVGVTYLNADEYELFQVTEWGLETTESVKARVSEKHLAKRYCEEVFGEEK